MIHVRQDIFMTSDKNIRGNCLQAAIASVMEMPLEQVPHFVQMDQDHLDNPAYDWFLLLRKWLKKRGFRILPLSFDGISPDEYYLVVGASPRGHGLRHAVIYKNGVLAHDPHPDDTGILSIDSLYSIRPFLS